MPFRLYSYMMVTQLTPIEGPQVLLDSIMCQMAFLRLRMAVIILVFRG